MFLGDFRSFSRCAQQLSTEKLSAYFRLLHTHKKIKTTKSRTRKLTRDPQHGRPLIIFLLVLFAGKMFQVLSAFCQPTPIEEIALEGRGDN